MQNQAMYSVVDDYKYNYDMLITLANGKRGSRKVIKPI